MWGDNHLELNPSSNRDLESVEKALARNAKDALDDGLHRLAGRQFTVRTRLLDLQFDPTPAIHEMSPAMFAVESGSWDLLPVPARNGLNLNERQGSFFEKDLLFRGSFLCFRYHFYSGIKAVMAINLFWITFLPMR